MSTDTSDISINSRSRILFTSLGGREATGLNGPGVLIANSDLVSSGSGCG